MDRVLSGMRATGRLHIGHLVGVLENWKKLQEEYECYFFVADWHGLTDDPKRAYDMKENVRLLFLDWLSVGIDPEKSVLFVQSMVPEHAELHLVFSMLINLSKLFRNPSYKEKLEELKLQGIKSSERRILPETLRERMESMLESSAKYVSELDDPKEILRKLKSDFYVLLEMLVEDVSSRIVQEITETSFHSVISYGFLGYPVLQSADILLYKPKFVPVGKDQEAHVEISREIARMFNRTFREVFPLPKPLFTSTPKVPGMDGRKMSKSYNNAIFISDSEQEVISKVRMYITDPNKIRKNDPGRPEICPVFALHKVFNPNETEEIYKDCTSGKLGCVECKKRLASRLNEHLEPIRQKRHEVEKLYDDVFDVLKEGSRKARTVASRTMQEVKEAMGMLY